MPHKMNKEKLNNTVKVVTDYLAKPKYDELVNLSNGDRLSADDIEYRVKDYGRSITELPGEGYQKIDVIEIDNSNPREWSVNVPIYTKEEGMSDLTLELTLIDSISVIYGVEFDNLHVL